jgi:hypothetical protein
MISQISRVRHLSLNAIWSFAKSQTKPAAPEFNHLINCDECVSVLGLCHMHDSIATVQQRLIDRYHKKSAAT